jgi:hypothetical protein
LVRSILSPGVRSFLPALPLLLLLGCGSGVDTHQVTGTITYQGKPIPAGNIIFSPDTDKGNKGPGTVAEIKDGKFSTPPKKGVVGGAYRLEINGYDGVPIPGGEGGMDPRGKPLFPTYQMALELPKPGTPLEIKVPVVGRE